MARFQDSPRQPAGKKSRLDGLLASLREIDEPSSLGLDVVQTFVEDQSWGRAAHAALRMIGFDKTVSVFEQDEVLLTLIGELELLFGKLPQSGSWAAVSHPLWVRVATICLAKVDPSFRADLVWPPMPTRLY